QFWHYSGNKAVPKEKIRANKLDGFFKKHKDDFSPRSIYRAKTIGRVKKHDQLQFVDLGLMPAIEKQEGEYLTDLMVRVIDGLYNARNKPEMTNNMGKWLFQAAFWLIGAKILKDKEVESFTKLKISNIESLIGKVQRHYGAADKLDISKISQRKAMEMVAEKIVEPVFSLSHITNESLAYVYENTLVSKATRKALGTHATPSWLVNYIVWQLVDWIEEIPEDERIIMEPACGHAPFLTAGARILSFLYEGSEEKRHDYLKSHLVGIEKDSFAIEIARLSLTLADIPNKDGWDIRNKDIYKTDVLQNLAKQATILLCNPPFENFSKEKRLEYDGIETGNKAAEILARTLPYMQPNSVFGVILPHGFLHKKNLADLRKYILDNFTLRLICNLPDNVFTKAGHPSTVLLGRKVKSKKKISYLRIHKSDLETFKDSYQAKETSLSKNELYKTENYSFRLPELKEVWDYCKEFSEFQEYATIVRGIEYKGGLNIDKKRNSRKFPYSQKGFYSYSENVCIDKVPELVWLNTSAQYVKNKQSLTTNKKKILLNYIRRGRNPWRLSPWKDDVEGNFCSNAFLAIIPKDKFSLNIILAILTSPFANMYVHDHCMGKHNSESVLNAMPVPFASQDLSRLEKLVEEYFEFSQQQERFTLGSDDKAKKEKKSCLLKIDAEVLRLYDLPPRLEKQLLDSFTGHKRKGVDFDFDEYYPKEFSSYIPLRMYISEEFQNSTVENIEKWIEDTRSPQVIKALDNAVKAFEGE
ncbi:MAG: N-6 DNA methylase, partial [Candidatus Aenigmarchaeota archaeon]|nr:N-6 DNA methylase [Candidatus Aenigmarchaeota archaeon]